MTYLEYLHFQGTRICTLVFHALSNQPRHKKICHQDFRLDLCVCVCVCVWFGFNVVFNNLSVISRRCLVATVSSMLTFIVLHHCSIKSQTLYFIPPPVTIMLKLGRPFLALPRKSECQVGSN